MRSSKPIGYVYAIGSNGRVKIGSSTTPEKRLHTISLQSGLSTESSKFTSCLVIDHPAKEREIHKAFHDRRINGEWFDVDFNQAKEAIEKICKPESKKSLDHEMMLKKMEAEEHEKNMEKVARALIPIQAKDFEMLRKKALESALIWCNSVENPKYADDLMKAQCNLTDILLVESSAKTEIIKNLMSDIDGYLKMLDEATALIKEMRESL